MKRLIRCLNLVILQIQKLMKCSITNAPKYLDTLRLVTRDWCQLMTTVNSPLERERQCWQHFHWCLMPRNFFLLQDLGIALSVSERWSKPQKVLQITSLLFNYVLRTINLHELHKKISFACKLAEKSIHRLAEYVKQH